MCLAVLTLLLVVYILYIWGLVGLYPTIYPPRLRFFTSSVKSFGRHFVPPSGFDLERKKPRPTPYIHYIYILYIYTYPTCMPCKILSFLVKITIVYRQKKIKILSPRAISWYVFPVIHIYNMPGCV